MIEWVTTNWNLVLSAIAGVIGLAAIIVKFTSTTKDDEVVDKVAKVFESATGKKV